MEASQRCKYEKLHSLVLVQEQEPRGGQGGVHRDKRQAVGSMLVLLVLVAVVSILVGLTVGLIWRSNVVLVPSGDSQDPYNWGDILERGGKEETVTSYFAEKLRAFDMKMTLNLMSQYPHIAGSERNRDLATSFILGMWAQYDFDNVEVYNYSVLLSFPNSSAPNSLTLRHNDSKVIHTAHIQQEPPLTPGEDDPNVVPPFNAYSGSGNVSGPLVYVNYGRQNDYRYLAWHLGLNLSNHICIVRYGGIFRGDKAKLAQEFGCKGLLIYSDPHDYAPEGVATYPDGPSLPEYGVQRGSLSRLPGDLLTPGIPATDGMNRRQYSDAQKEFSVPIIPVQPISYGDAIHFMEQLTDMVTPDDWVGGLDVKYRIMQSKQNTNYTELVVNNYQEKQTIYDVVAKIYGAVEPDRQVILGNHRDAWVFGAADPTSGTTTLMAIAETLGELRKSKWRPGRTITLCSWGAEEYGLIGSTEWVEDFGKLLELSTLAYLNVDTAVSGIEHFSAGASPLLYEVIWQAAGMVPCPNNSFTSVYDQWLNASSAEYKGTHKPAIGVLGSGSDFTSFYQFYGISSASMGYSNDTQYAVYHSVHDNFDWMSKFGDPDFTHHQATAAVWGIAALLLATTPLPPVDLTHYSDWAEKAVEAFNKKEDLKERKITLTDLMNEVRNFGSACANLTNTMDTLRKDSDHSQKLSTIRMVMDRVMNIERTFILPEGIPGTPFFKHMLMAPDPINSYGNAIFPGFNVAINNASEFGGSWEVVRTQRDLLTTHFRYATQILNDPALKFSPN